MQIADMARAIGIQSFMAGRGREAAEIQDAAILNRAHKKSQDESWLPKGVLSITVQFGASPLPSWASTCRTPLR